MPELKETIHLQDLWNPDQAQKLSNDPLALLRYRSNLLGADLRMELTLIWLVGTTILDKIEDADYDVFTQRPQIRRRDKALIMARAAKGWASHMDLAALKALWPA